MKPPRSLLLVVEKLGLLRERVVFVGGMVRGLLTTDPAAGPPRPTDDVDLIVDVHSIVDYHVFGEALRERGFSEDTSENAPICRWRVEGVATDVMPIDPSVLGFTNVWYEGAMQHATSVETEHGVLRLVDGPHFCATKLEAFASRAAGDWYHHDLEDFVGLVDERPTLVEEITEAAEAVREFIAETTRELLNASDFVDALPGHLAADEVSQQRLPDLIEKLQRIAALAEPVSVREPTRPARPGASPAARARPSGVASFWQGNSGLTTGTHGNASGRIYVSSSNLDWIEYAAGTDRLTVGFVNGHEYSYDNVPESVYRGLLGAYSKGRYFHRWIRGRYLHRKVR